MQFQQAIRRALQLLIAVALAFATAGPAAAATTEEMQLLNAASYCYVAEIVTLLDRGVDSEARSTGGHTPLIMAAYGQCAEGVKILLARGADLSARDQSGYTAVDLARLYGYRDIEALLTGSDAPQRANPDQGGPGGPTSGGTDPVAPPGLATDPLPQTPRQSDAGATTCKEMYLSCQSTCGYFSGGQWVMDYSCSAQCAECNRACEAGHVTACTDTFRPWGGQ